MLGWRLEDFVITDKEAKWGSVLSQTASTSEYTTACDTLFRHQHNIALHQAPGLRHLCPLQWCHRTVRAPGVTGSRSRPGLVGAWEVCPSLHISNNPRCLWSFVGSIGAVTWPLVTGNERETAAGCVSVVADLFMLRV